MTAHMNQSHTRRPELAPLWIDHRGRRVALPTVRTAHAALLSPSPQSPKTLPSLVRQTDRAVIGDRVADDAPRASLPRASLPTPVKGPSPLVSELEKVSLQIADNAKPNTDASDPISPSTSQGGMGASATHVGNQYRERNGSATVPDTYIIARSLRPLSDTSPTEGSFSQWSDYKTLRAVVQPQAGKPILVQLTSDSPHGLQATMLAKDSLMSPESASPARHVRRPLPDLPRPSPHVRHPSTGLSSPKSSPRSSEFAKSIRDQIAVPIYSKRTLSGALPKLGRLLNSDHVKRGDVIFLPVPHAKAWPQTVGYVYTRRGELTEPMRQNILYLGGRV
ncbi:hypothetical protein F5Y17DRAFT_459928 [Xylariaceae sp. FL0594]|nr:hypothetical protein F5Y17DRAFT_459928 [Xylariaceae sp. FL0594]